MRSYFIIKLINDRTTKDIFFLRQVEKLPVYFQVNLQKLIFCRKIIKVSNLISRAPKKDHLAMYIQNKKYRLDILKYIFLFLFNLPIYSEPIILDESLFELDITKNLFTISDNEFDINNKIELTSLKTVDSDYIIKKNSQLEPIYYFSVIKKQEKRFFLELTENIVDVIEIYYLSDKILKKVYSGNMNPLGERLKADRNFIFDIPFETNNILHIFIKIKSHRPNIFQIKLYSEEGLWKISKSRNITLGVYYSFLVVPGLVFLTFYLGSRYFEYLNYFFYVVLILMLHLWIDSTYLYLFDYMPISFNFLYYANLLILEWYILYCFINMNIFFEDLNLIRKNYLYYLGINLTFFIPLFREDYHIVLYLSFFNTISIFLFKSYYLLIKRKKEKSFEKRFYSFLWYPIVLGLLIYHLQILGYINNKLISEYVVEFFNCIEILVMSSVIIFRINFPNELSMITEEENTNINKINKQIIEKSESKEIEIISELRKASELQRNLTPIQEKKYPLIDAKFYYEYYMEVGGDFFDIISNDNDSVSVYIADASGHGISSALLATMYKICFTNAISKYSSPELIYKEVNLQTSKVLYTHDYLTAFLAVIHKDGKMIYSSAAHRPALIYRKNSNMAEVLYAKGLFLGMKTGFPANYEERIERLLIGDRILFYTDGIFNDSIKEIWNTEVLMKVFVKSSRKNIEKALKQIVQEWKSYLPESKAHDDASLLLIEFTGDKKL